MKYINSKFWKRVETDSNSSYKLNPKGGNVWNHGSWYLGNWLNGTWKNGCWHDGIWNDGIWEDGLWLVGYWLNGTWYKGRCFSFYDKGVHEIEVSPKSFKKPKYTLSLNYAIYKE